jgi:hypothetical protein
MELIENKPHPGAPRFSLGSENRIRFNKAWHEFQEHGRVQFAQADGQLYVADDPEGDFVLPAPGHERASAPIAARIRGLCGYSKTAWMPALVFEIRTDLAPLQYGGRLFYRADNNYLLSQQPLADNGESDS